MAIKCACPNCDRSYTLADNMSGKTIRCKDCEKTFTVEDADEGVMSADDVRRKRTASVASGSSRGGHDDDEDDKPRRRSKNRDEEDEDEGPPKKKKKQSGAPVGLIIGGGIGLLAIIAGVVVLIVLLAGGGSLTAANIAKLKEGMTESEVIALIGSPTQTIDIGALGGLLGAPVGNGKELVWTNQKDLTVNVSFENGKAKHIISLDLNNIFGGNPLGNPKLPGVNPPGFNPPVVNPPGFDPPVFNPPVFNPPVIAPKPPPDPRLTKDNIRKLKKGMSEQELTNIVGPPTNKTDFAVVGDPSKKCFMWSNPALAIDFTVWATNNKADSIIGHDIFSGIYDGFDKPTNPAPGPGPIVGPNPNPGPGPGPIVGPKPAGVDVKQLQPNMTEQQITTMFGQPTSATDIPMQLMAAKQIAAKDVQRPDGSLKPAKSLVYPRAAGQPGQVELILIEGRLYRFASL
jgi:outer membrane protein assembly factor BamE (lipoprotein component of BamABCDE complex)